MVYRCKNVKIGEECLIYPNVVIREDTLIGGDSFDFAAAGGKIRKISQVGKVEIGNDVEIGANTTIDRATVDVIRIGK